MVCVKWVGDNCEKFEMKCKGEPGYPTANQATQGTTSGTTGTADPGTKGTQGIRGRPNVKGNAATKETSVRANQIALRAGASWMRCSPRCEPTARPAGRRKPGPCSSAGC